MNGYLASRTIPQHLVKLADSTYNRRRVELPGVGLDFGRRGERSLKLGPDFFQHDFEEVNEPSSLKKDAQVITRRGMEKIAVSEFDLEF